MEVQIDSSWKEILADEFEKPYFKTLRRFVRDEYGTSTVYPQAKHIFRAFDLCPFDTVKVVIIGQDPYHGAGQATGLSFSVAEGVRVPPSLQNIYTEMTTDLDLQNAPHSGDLSRLAAQGVLLLNAMLTVRAREAGSHQGKGWEQFTDAAIGALSEKREHLVFILWGNYARTKGAHIDRAKHLVLESSHPSPFSARAGFFGSKPFSKTNAYLAQYGNTPIDWA